MPGWVNHRGVWRFCPGVVVSQRGEAGGGGGSLFVWWQPEEGGGFEVAVEEGSDGTGEG